MLSRIFIVTLACAASQAERLGKAEKPKPNKRDRSSAEASATNVYGKPLSKCR